MEEFGLLSGKDVFMKVIEAQPGTQGLIFAHRHDRQCGGRGGERR